MQFSLAHFSLFYDTAFLPLCTRGENGCCMLKGITWRGVRMGGFAHQKLLMCNPL